MRPCRTRRRPGDKPALGTIKAEADTQVSVERAARRLFGAAGSPRPTSRRWASRRSRRSSRKSRSKIVQQGRVIALDRVLASVDKSQIIPKNVEGVKADPPAVFFSKTPAVSSTSTAIRSGARSRATISKYAVNTNWDLFEHAPTKTFYLRHDASWLQGDRASTAPWTPAGTLPDSFKKLPADDNWKDVKAALPGKKLSSSAVPKVFVSTKPAELIHAEGRAQLPAGRAARRCSG